VDPAKTLVDAPDVAKTLIDKPDMAANLLEDARDTFAATEVSSTRDDPHRDLSESHDEPAKEFFSKPPPALPAEAPSDAPIEIDTRDPRQAQKMTAAAIKRRAHLARYVKAAVAISAILCLAALVRVAIARNQRNDAIRTSAASMQQQTTEAPAAPPVVEPPKTEETKPAENAAKPEETKPAETAKAEETKPEEIKPAVERDPKAALKEKQTAQTMLERGKLADAIAAGEKSVELDPTDAEAWLILGATYQQKGDAKSATRAFKSCVEQATRGPKGECRAFAH
jgi:hypothetical protein